MVIGLGAGIVKARDVLLNEELVDPQAAMDILGTWMGQELAKELLAQKLISPSERSEVLLGRPIPRARRANRRFRQAPMSRWKTAATSRPI